MIKDFFKKTLSNIKIRLSQAFGILFKSFFKTVGVIAGIIVFMYVLVGLYSTGLLYFRDSIFNTKVLWEFVKKDESVEYVPKDTVFGLNNKKEIAVVRASGTIMPDCSQRVLCPKTFEDLFDYFKLNDNVKAVVILLNSPGGEVYASEAIYQEIKSLSQKIPVIVYVESETASGAYYISLGATKIYASPVATIGSIGVYMEVLDYDGLLDKLGIKHKYIVSSHAKYKLISKWLFEDNKDGEYVSQQIQDLIDASEQVFRDRVKENRPSVDLDKLNGLIFSSKKALDLHLIDGIYDTPQQVIKDLLKQDVFENGNYYVVEYSLNDLGSINGLRSTFTRFSTLLYGSRDVRIMWQY